MNFKYYFCCCLDKNKDGIVSDEEMQAGMKKIKEGIDTACYFIEQCSEVLNRILFGLEASGVDIGKAKEIIALIKQVNTVIDKTAEKATFTFQLPRLEKVADENQDGKIDSVDFAISIAKQFKEQVINVQGIVEAAGKAGYKVEQALNLTQQADKLISEIVKAPANDEAPTSPALLYDMRRLER